MKIPSSLAWVLGALTASVALKAATAEDATLK
jgi:hypothetical protein